MEKIWLEQYQDGVPGEINPDSYASVADMLNASIQRNLDKNAFTNMGNSLDFASLDKKSKAVAAYLQARGFVKGDRFAIMLPNVLQFPVMLLGAMRAGLVIVNVNPLYTAKELRHILKDSSAKGIVTLNSFAHTVEKAMTANEHNLDLVITTEMGDLFPTVKRCLVNFVVKHVKRMEKKWSISSAVKFRDLITQGEIFDFNPVDIGSDDIAFLQYTGGTTGRAKGAILTNRNMVANISQILALVTPLHKENGLNTIITPLPLYHIFSLVANCLTFMCLGSCSILITNPRDIKTFVKELKRQPFNGITGVNTLFNALVHDDNFKTVDFSNMFLALGGGMSIQSTVAKEWLDVTGVPLTEGYGLTEASPVVCVNPLNSDRYTGSIGLPVPSTDIFITDSYGNELSVGEEGELWVKGPQVMKGYWNNPEETKEVITESGWLATGDIAKVDEKGYVYIVDRKKDMILVSGFNVYPNEVEEVLASHPAIKEVAVVGVKYKDNTELVKACIVLEDGYAKIEKKTITDFCRESLTSYKIPRMIEFMDDLPKTNVGKVLRRELRDE